ncbi:hypothetical protein [Rhizobium alvei]|uniref:Uncharacterized protein n=1 Tax=Rhizobium alvei TaxID=1132659 RepID=A0ABT8YGA6_9HYPH|nr:hypothetical protein [Rhizobium alvei]MDO6962700.1 hypothetical protein [Rhizobium alvei]
MIEKMQFLDRRHPDLMVSLQIDEEPRSRGLLSANTKKMRQSHSIHLNNAPHNPVARPGLRLSLQTQFRRLGGGSGLS